MARLLLCGGGLSQGALLPARGQSWASRVCASRVSGHGLAASSNIPEYCVEMALTDVAQAVQQYGQANFRKHDVPEFFRPTGRPVRTERRLGLRGCSTEPCDVVGWLVGEAGWAGRLVQAGRPAGWPEANLCRKWRRLITGGDSYFKERHLAPLTKRESKGSPKAVPLAGPKGPRGRG